MTTESKDGPTPHGGIRSEVYYLDKARKLVDKEDATQAEIVELDSKDDIIYRTYGTFNNPKKKNDQK